MNKEQVSKRSVPARKSPASTDHIDTLNAGKTGKTYPKMNLPHKAFKAGKDLPVGKKITAKITLKKTAHKETAPKGPGDLQSDYDNSSDFEIHSMSQLNDEAQNDPELKPEDKDLAP